jgi:hypothetical protein
VAKPFFGGVLNIRGDSTQHEPPHANRLGRGVKRPDFEKRKPLGSLSDGAEQAARRETLTPEDRIAEKQVVYLQYKGRTLSLLVTKVVEQRRSYEGRILGFLSPDAPVLKMADLKVGDVVCFDHDAIWNVQRQRSA